MPLYNRTGSPEGTGPMTGRKKGLAMLGQVERPPTLAELMRDLGPALQTMGTQYQRAGPLVDFLIDNYWLVVLGLGGLVFGAAAVGAWYGSKQEKIPK